MTNENLKTKSRKINLKKCQYQLPDIDDNKFMLDDEYEQEENEKTSLWLDSLSQKSQYDITESLCVAW